MDSRSENYRVNVKGLKRDPLFGIIHRVDHVYDVEATTRMEAKDKAIEQAKENTDDENYDYSVVRAFLAKPREQQNYSGVETDEDS